MVWLARCAGTVQPGWYDRKGVPVRANHPEVRSSQAYARDHLEGGDMVEDCAFCGASVERGTSRCPSCGGRHAVLDDPADEVGLQKHEERPCLRCGGPTAIGALLPRSINLSGAGLLVRWYRGAGRFSKFWGDQRPAEDSRGLAVHAFRCERCGHLELVALSVEP